MAKTARITGITGQDGAYPADLLLEKTISFMALKGIPHLLTRPASTIFTFGTSKAIGTPRKIMDVSRMRTQA